VSISSSGWLDFTGGELLRNFRICQTAGSKNQSFDEDAFQCFIDLHGGKNLSAATSLENQKAITSPKALVHVLANFFHLDSPKI
jgi:hypothetical protein